MKSNPFNSFWQAGYEGADHITGMGKATDMNRATGHCTLAAEDYAQLANFRIKTVRESVGWRASDTEGRLDFSNAILRAQAAHDCGIQILWTFCHYGVPPDVPLLSTSFISRFAHFCAAAARVLWPYQVGAMVVTPVNEISFLTWARSSTHLMGRPLSDPHALKCHLVEASLIAMERICEVVPDCRFLHTDPLIYVAHAPHRPDQESASLADTEASFESWDMLGGYNHPQLGGSLARLDIIGVNYYHSNQWEYETDNRLHWHLGDPRRKSLSELLSCLWQRYRRPILISETSHVGAGRGEWILDVTREVRSAQARGIEICGICVYPILDRPDWNDNKHWHRSGLWDLRENSSARVESASRILNDFYASDLRRAQRALNTGNLPFYPRTPDSNMLPIVVFSHLRWSFVFQRPQQLLTRLAAHFPIIFIEEPVYDATRAQLHQSTPAPNVRVLTPHTPVLSPGFNDTQRPYLAALIAAFVTENALETCISWFYTPMALGLQESLQSSIVVFDCMDNLAGFKDAPSAIADKERELLNISDLIFTGGVSLQRAKASSHSAVHCFPSSVDQDHFASSRVSREAWVASGAERAPRLGYVGVIDERMDIPLIDAMAAIRPDWEFVFVGPVVKIDPAALPRHANITYVGQQPYEALPDYLAGFDVALMPFALNEATRFISPTKTLEYMAASIPVVSTPIADVVEPYEGVVAIASTPSEFVAACERLLTETQSERAIRTEMMDSIVQATSWDDTCAKMQLLIEVALAEKRAKLATATRVRSPVPLPRTVDTIIVGAGLSGIAASTRVRGTSCLINPSVEWHTSARAMWNGPANRFAEISPEKLILQMHGLDSLPESAHYSAAIDRIAAFEHRLYSGCGANIEYGTMVSDLPLPQLLAAFGDDLPPAIRRSVPALPYVSLRLVRLQVQRDGPPVRARTICAVDRLIRRIHVFESEGDFCADRQISFVCEISYDESAPLPSEGPALIEACLAECIAMHLIWDADVVLPANQTDLPYAYLCYDDPRARQVGKIRRWLSDVNILMASSQSAVEHYEPAAAWRAGIRAANEINAGTLSASAPPDPQRYQQSA